MTITKNLNGTALEIALAGRLDTMTAPELEAELNKAMAAKGGMKICNVNEVVQEVFEVTGFADILTIE